MRPSTAWTALLRWRVFFFLNGGLGGVTFMGVWRSMSRFFCFLLCLFRVVGARVASGVIPWRAAVAVSTCLVTIKRARVFHAHVGCGSGCSGHSLFVCLFSISFVFYLLDICLCVLPSLPIVNAPAGLIYSAPGVVCPCSTLIPQKTPSVPHSPSGFVSSSSVPLRQTYWCAMIASMPSLFDPNRHLFYR